VPGLKNRAVTVVLSLGLIVASGLTAAWLGAVGTTRYVDDNTCPLPGSGTQNSPYCRIQDAICAAVSGDTVSVAPGTYPESLRMKPGVSLISQGGAAVTTINAAGQPCTDLNFCTKLTGGGCSVVLFGSGHTTATRLDGFTITGGTGRVQPTLSQVAGGGIFVFSSATIVNNVITNNVISGPERQFNGGGVYVALGAPVISNNTISGNRAVPPAGTSGSVTYGYGGGIWVGFSSDPIITNNVISGNRAGDPNTVYSLGAGGGVVVWPGDASHPGPRIDRNFIADNFSDSLGGGVAITSLFGTAAPAVVTNNVMVGNASKNGGGVYTYFARTDFINNTITENTAFLGGGVYSGQSDPTLPVSISNNIIYGNHLETFGSGGGIYTLDLSASFDPAIRSNDLCGNDGAQVAGDKTDAMVIGVNGNICDDPLFVNRAARDFHLGPNSPAIDTAEAGIAPTVDKDGLPRGVDGNGIPNNPVAGDVDMGAYERQAGCVPTAEICDGQDNNCNLSIDEGFPDFDGDGLANCVDPDDDNDQVLDGSDCSPLDASAFAAPGEVGNLDASGASPTIITFATLNTGPGTRYEVVSGLLRRLTITGGFQEDFCDAASLVGGAWSDTRPAPPRGDGWFYLARGFNVCGRGTLGSAAADAPGSGDVCLAGIVDADADGSPSDLDCNDDSIARSPLNVELCDGIDNDCDGTPDNHVIDSDGDGLDDCADLNDDGDGAPDATDCAPLDPTAFGVPSEVQDVDVLASSPTSITWFNQAIGAGTRYDIATGLIAACGVIDFTAGGCLAGTAASPAQDAGPAPPPGGAWYYMVKSRNACGAGTYGSAARDGHPACP